MSGGELLPRAPRQRQRRRVRRLRDLRRPSVGRRPVAFVVDVRPAARLRRRRRRRPAWRSQPQGARPPRPPSPAHAVRRMCNSPLAFTLGHEVRKAAYALGNLLPGSGGRRGGGRRGGAYINDERDRREEDVIYSYHPPPAEGECRVPSIFASGMHAVATSISSLKIKIIEWFRKTDLTFFHRGVRCCCGVAASLEQSAQRPGPIISVHQSG